jgi:hypothetical protein
MASTRHNSERIVSTLRGDVPETLVPQVASLLCMTFLPCSSASCGQYWAASETTPRSTGRLVKPVRELALFGPPCLNDYWVLRKYAIIAGCCHHCHPHNLLVTTKQDKCVFVLVRSSALPFCWSMPSNVVTVHVHIVCIHSVYPSPPIDRHRRNRQPIRHERVA